MECATCLVPVAADHIRGQDRLAEGNRHAQETREHQGNACLEAYHSSEQGKSDHNIRCMGPGLEVDHTWPVFAILRSEIVRQCTWKRREGR